MSQWLEVRQGRMTTEKGVEPPSEYEALGRLRLEAIRTTNGVGEIEGLWPECPFREGKDQTHALYLEGPNCKFHFAWVVEIRDTKEGKVVVLRYRKREGELPVPTPWAPEGDAHDAGHGGHHELGFFSKYVFSLDHKTIGIQFLSTSILFGILGGLLAMALRWQLAWPFDVNHPVPYLGEQLWADAGGIMSNDYYNSFVTMHGTIMVFFFVIPLLVGGFGNFLIPLMIGADDMAFPRLNMWSYWVYLFAGLVMFGSFFIPGGAHQGGWTSYPPLSATAYQMQKWLVPGTKGLYVGGVDLWLLSIAIVGASSLMGAINYITTILNMRAPGLHFMRLPLLVWALFITSILNLLAVPVLTAGGILLLFDRLLGTSFFAPAGGGHVLLWQHLFWFFGHPEVYIIILPGMGVISEILPTFCRKPIYGYHGMVYAMSGIGGLGFIVWGHHMFASGMSPVMGSAFMIATLFIAVPSAIKVFNWIGTLWGGNIRLTPPLLAGVGFVAMFILGGVTGIFLASPAVDIYLHDTYFVVAHFHYVAVSASIFAIMGGIYYWFPKMTGRQTNQNLGILHVALTFVFLNLTFGPMHFSGLAGHMRRIATPEEYAHIKHLTPLNLKITMMAFTLFTVQLLFLGNILWSLFFGKKVGPNPWEGATLEWLAPSPPPHGNFEKVPTVYHGPYEYSHPALEKTGRDYAPMWEKIPGIGEGGH